MVQVRPLQESDKGAWLELWHGYLRFYKTSLSDEQTELTWNRLLDPNYNSNCFVVTDNGQVVGITHYALQTSTWAKNNYCYLEDLFVNPDLRGKGYGRALIDAVRDFAITQGSSRLYWNTDHDNTTARKLYDTYTNESGKVQYRIHLNSNN